VSTLLLQTQYSQQHRRHLEQPVSTVHVCATLFAFHFQPFSQLIPFVVFSCTCVAPHCLRFFVLIMSAFNRNGKFSILLFFGTLCGTVAALHMTAAMHDTFLPPHQRSAGTTPRQEASVQWMLTLLMAGLSLLLVYVGS